MLRALIPDTLHCELSIHVFHLLLVVWHRAAGSVSGPVLELRLEIDRVVNAVKDSSIANDERGSA